MEVLVLDGKEYTKAAKAARDLGYTADYVGQLCRSGQVTAHLIGRTWYVDKEELTSHRHEKKRMSRAKAREQAKQSIAEHRAKKEKDTKNYKNLAISYETDPSELIPETRKLEVETEAGARPKTRKGSPKGPKYEIENRGEKIIMKGRVQIEDASDEAPDPHTTILKPTIISGEEEAEQTPKKKTAPKKAGAPQQESSKASESKTDFMAKLEGREAFSTQDSEPQADETSGVTETATEAPPQSERRAPSLTALTLLLLLIIITSIASLPLSRTTTYTAESVVPVSGTFTYDLDKTIELLKEKF